MTKLMKKEWAYLEKGEDGHYPNGAWFYQNCEPTTEGHYHNMSFKDGFGTVTPARDTSKGKWYSEMYRPRIYKYHEDLEEAKAYIELMVTKRESFTK